MYRLGLDYAFCACSIFSGGRELEAEGNKSCVVDAVGKRETAIYLKRWCRRWRKMEEAGECSKRGRAHGMHLVKVEAHTHYASVSPKAECFS